MRISTFHPLRLFALLAPVFLGFALTAQPTPIVQDPMTAHAASRIDGNVESGTPILLRGNRAPLARPEFESGVLAPSYSMQRMVLVLQPSAEQQSTLDALLEAQRDPASPLYHQWLTPAQYAEHFGVSAEDVQRVTGWLQSHGFEIDEVAASHRSITFSGAASQVEATFRTQMRSYLVNGKAHVANATDPSIPSALTPVVAGVLSLHDFPLYSMHTGLRGMKTGPPSPEITLGTSHFVTPGDLAVIYNVNPLYTQGIDGSGQSIAVVGRSNIHLADVAAFRSSFGLPANNPQVIVNGTDPGTANSDELPEATLDVEYAGALARKASVKFVTSASTAASDGVFLSAQYIVNQNLAPVMTMSFGLCEASMGAAQNAFINALWQQAAAQGITVLVSAGDSGAAGCDSGSVSSARSGLAVNGLCSSPYSTCVGGTEFNDTANPSLYWAAYNAANTSASALSYIPELVWNESSRGAGLWAGGGGASSIYGKPQWQVGTGVPGDGKRDVPDISLSASAHNGYMIVMNGLKYALGGTSASTPTAAGIFALVNQSTGTRQGLANPTLYALASRQNGGGAAVFHDTIAGNNSVPGLTGFTATAGFDRATGLGSIDANALVLHWRDGQAAPAIQLSLGSNTLSLNKASASSVAVKLTPTGTLSSAVMLAASGMPTGMTATFSPASVPLPGSGGSTLQISVGSSVAAGTYNVAVKAGSGTVTSTASIAVTVIAPSLSIAGSANSVTMTAGSSHAITLTTVVSGVSANVPLKVTGLPAGVTATFSPSTIAAPGSGRSVLTFAASSSAKPGSYVVLITGTAGALSQSVQCTVNVPSISVVASTPGISLAQGASATVTFTTAIAGGFNSMVAISLAGLPSGVSAVTSPTSLAAPGAGVVSIKFIASSAAKVGAAKISVVASGGGLSAAAPLTLTVKQASSLTVKPSPQGTSALPVMITR